MIKKLFIIHILFLMSSLCLNAQDDKMSLSAPVKHCSDCDTLTFKSGQPVIFFVYINEVSILPVNERSEQYREWLEVKKAFSDKKIKIIDLNTYSLIRLGKNNVLDYTNMYERYDEVLYWNGKDNVSPIPIKKPYSCVAERIAKLRNESYTSSYMPQYKSDSLFFFRLLQPAQPSVSMVENMRYHANQHDKTLTYLPYQFLNLENVKAINFGVDSLLSKKYARATFNQDQAIDSIVTYANGEKYIDNLFTYKNGLLKSNTQSGKDKIVYRGDTIINYKEHYGVYTLSIEVLKGKLFVPFAYYTLDSNEKTFTSSVNTITEQGKAITITEGNFSTKYSNTRWELPLEITTTDLKSKQSSTIKYQRHITSNTDNIIVESNNDKIIFNIKNHQVQSAVIYNDYKKRYTNLVYQYDFY